MLSSPVVKPKPVGKPEGSPKGPLQFSQGLLRLLGTTVQTHFCYPLPPGGQIIISNHRSFLDAPVLMSALNQPIHFACHHYMGQVPLMRDFVTQLGGFPLDGSGRGQKQFFDQATQRLKLQTAIGIFPEGPASMVRLNPPRQLCTFHRGFAHLALRSPVSSLSIVPTAILSTDQGFESPIPLKLLSLFDPQEPLFNQPGGHPILVYRQTRVLVGRPLVITDRQRQQYRGKGAKALVEDITEACRQEVSRLLKSA
jgi:1-acyl-sn-glycerol-3-phosphate acyltransferase